MTHEPRLVQIASTGTLRLITPCEICGAYAAHGFGVFVLRYIRARERGEEPDKRHLGRWRCSKHLEGA